MKRAVVLLFVAAVGFAGATTSADAAIRKWSVEPSVMGGWMKNDVDLRVDDTTFSGFGLSFSIHPTFQVEINTSTITTESNRLSRSDDEFKKEMTGMRLVATFLGDQDVRTMPFIAAGGGKIKTTADLGGNRPSFSNDSSYAEVAVGARVFVWKDLCIRPELGVRHSRIIDFKGEPTTDGSAYFAVSVSYFLFGAK